MAREDVYDGDDAYNARNKWNENDKELYKRLVAVENTLDGVPTQVDQLQNQIEQLQNIVSGHTGQLGSLTTQQNTNTGNISSLLAKMSSVESSISSINSSISTLNSKTTLQTGTMSPSGYVTGIYRNNCYNLNNLKIIQLDLATNIPGNTTVSIGTLPASFRPSSNLTIQATANHTIGGGGNMIVDGTINTAGVISVTIGSIGTAIANKIIVSEIFT